MYETDTRQVSSEDTACLNAQDLNIGYNHDTVVADINLALKVGQSLALVGTNGSGKTTFLKTIVGLQRPLGGRITSFGRNPGSLPHRTAYLSQFHVSGFVLPLRAIDVVSMGRFSSIGLLGRATKQYEELVIEAMQRMGIDHLANSPICYM